MPPALAAILAVSEAVSESQQPLTTASESIGLVHALSNQLKACLAPDEALAVSAGTDAFQKQLVNIHPKLVSKGSSQPQSIDAAEISKKAIASVAHDYIQRSIYARRKIAAYGRKVITHGSTIIVPSYSAVVDGVLRCATDSGVEFQVIFVTDPNLFEGSRKSLDNLVEYLKQAEISVAFTDLDLIAQTMIGCPQLQPQMPLQYPASKATVLTGAAALLASGGMLASVATQTTCAIARAYERPVLVAAETAKIVKDLGLSKSLNKSLRMDAEAEPKPSIEETGRQQMGTIPANFITNFITEMGVHGPAVNAEEALKKWS